jgi:uncharacterized membrane protein
MTRTKQVLTVLGVLMLADVLLLVTSSLTTLAKAVQIPLYALFWTILYLDNRERFHRPVSRKVVFWSILGTLAALTVFVVLGLIIR